MKPNRDNYPIKWTGDIWDKIDLAANEEADLIRVLKPRFIAPESPPEGMVPVEQIDADTLEITGIGTQQYLELSAEFKIKIGLIDQEEKRGFCRHIAMEAGAKLALAEDRLFFQGAKAEETLHAAHIRLTVLEDKPLNQSLLEAAEARIIPVIPLIGNDTYGENTFAGVAKALALLDYSKPENYALFLEPTVYADIYALFASTFSNQLSLADRIKGLVGGVYKTGALPAGTGLVVRMNGEPANIYYADSKLYTEWTRQNDTHHFFRICERIQYVVRKPKAFVTLAFSPLENA